MQDGRTRRRRRPAPPRPLPAFLRDHRAALIVEIGPERGKELELADREQVMGRGEQVALRFDDPAMSREHAAFELVDGGFRVRDLASTNGIVVNDQEVLAAQLEDGDRIEIGEHAFRYVVEERMAEPAASVPDES